MDIVLASASPRRARLFSQVGIKYKVDPSDIHESIDESLAPETIVETLARHKAEDVAERNPNSFVIAADTIVCLNGNVLGKPENEEEARAYLRQLSDNTHDVYSGVFAGTTAGDSAFDSMINFSERPQVTFGSLTEEEIEYYITYGKPFDKAGSYGIQDDFGSLFVKKIEGDYYNVVGFPLHRFYSELKIKIPALFKEIFIPGS